MIEVPTPSRPSVCYSRSKSKCPLRFTCCVVITRIDGSITVLVLLRNVAIGWVKISNMRILSSIELIIFLSGCHLPPSLVAFFFYFILANNHLKLYSISQNDLIFLLENLKYSKFVNSSSPLEYFPPFNIPTILQTPLTSRQTNPLSPRRHRLQPQKPQTNLRNSQTPRSRPRSHHRPRKISRRHPLVRPHRQRQRIGHPTQLSPRPQPHR